MLIRIGKYFLFLSIVAIAFSCTKDIPPEMQTNNKKKMVENSKMPDDSIHRKFMTDPHQSMNSETGKEKTQSNEEELGDETARQNL